jgi:hypothetical protein
MLSWIVFFFIAFGAKVVLAFAMIYLIFPAERSCSHCDGETLPLRMGPLGRALAWLSRGEVQRRWCPRCGWEGLTRTGRLAGPGESPAEVAHQPSVR